MKRVNYLAATLTIAGVLLMSCKQSEPKNGDGKTGRVELSREEIAFGRTADAQTFTIVSNVDYTLECDQDWFFTNIRRGVASQTPETVRVETETFTGVARQGEVLIRAGGKKYSVVIKQFNAEITVYYPGNTIYTGDTITLADTPDPIDHVFRVRSTHQWETEADEWITVTPKRSSAINEAVPATAVVGVNTMQGQRKGRIAFHAIVGQGDTITKYVYVKQGKSNFFLLNKQDIEISDGGEIKKVRLTASGDWSLTASPAWLHVDKTSGTAGNITLNISADQRMDVGADRTGQITVVSGGQTKTITVRQGPAGAYWSDNEVLQVHQHTVGNGVPIVLIGDGFDRAELRKGGSYESKATELLVDYILNCQIFRDFKDYFDLYVYMAVSAESGTTPPNPDNAFDSGKSNGPNFDRAVNRINNHPTFKDVGRKCPDQIAIVFMGNGMIGGYAYFHIRAGIYSTDEGPNIYWSAHEFVGHGFTGLADEYASNCSYMGGPSALRSEQNKGNGLGLNVSWTNDTNLYWKADGNTTTNIAESNGNPCVPWKQFIGHPQYTGSNAVGFHEGGWYCPTGVWRPEAHSIMVNWRTAWGNGMNAKYYNAQSRWLIYKKVHDLAGISVDFDDFVAYDTINLLP